MDEPTNDNGRICRQSFITCIVLLLGICIPLALFPDQSAEQLKSIKNSMTSNFGVLFLFAGVACFIFLLWLAMSPFGAVKLGDKNDTPEFKEFSWAGMLFCAGVGAGLLRWVLVEWGEYYTALPHGVAPGSVAAKEWATAYPLFHWGPLAWAFYCLPAITIAYPFYVKKVPWLRMSTGLYGILGEKGLHGPIAKLIDILVVLSLLGGAGYSLGVTTPMISGAFSHLTGLKDGFYLQVITALFCAAIFSTSAYFGLRKGIKILSDWNIYLALFLLGFIFVAGPTVFIFETSLSSLGYMAQNFIVMSTWTDPFTDSSFVEDWTVFYWAWWVAYAPFVGLFVARISRGRTIRQVICGMLTYGSMGGMLFFMVMGNYAFDYTMNMDVAESAAFIQTMSSDYVTAIIQILNSLPLSKLIIGIFCLISVVFTATTYDSASYIIASTVTQKLHAGEDPAQWNRVFWAFALAALPIALMSIGVESVMISILLLTSFPILFIGGLSAWALVRQLKKDTQTAESESKN